MKVTHDNGLFKVSHISGPSRNYLGLKLTRGATPPSEPQLTVLPPIGACDGPSKLNLETVIAEITQGVAGANDALKTDYSAEYAEIVEHDSPREGIYKYLAKTIVQHANETDETP